MFRISVCVCTFLLVCCTLVAAQQPVTTTYYACITNSTGAIRIVNQNTQCLSTEHKINWNQTGPQGPQGPQGKQGPAGPQGPPGMSVGYSAIAPPGSDIPLTPSPALIVQTNPIAAAGTYFVSISSLPVVATGDGVAYCYDTLASTGTVSQFTAVIPANQYSPLSLTDMLSIKSGDSIQFYCYVGGNNGSTVYNAALTAILINSADDAPRRAGNPGAKPQSAMQRPH